MRSQFLSHAARLCHHAIPIPPLHAPLPLPVFTALLHPTPTPHPTEPFSTLPPSPLSLPSFFGGPLWRLRLASTPQQQLSREFCITLLDGKYLLVAAETPETSDHPPQPPHDQNPQQPQGTQEQPQQQQQRGSGAAALLGPPPSMDRMAVTTFFLVDLARGIKVDERRFEDDMFVLPLNACASVYDDLVTLLSVGGGLLWFF